MASAAAAADDETVTVTTAAEEEPTMTAAEARRHVLDRVLVLADRPPPSVSPYFVLCFPFFHFVQWKSCPLSSGHSSFSIVHPLKMLGYLLGDQRML